MIAKLSTETDLSDFSEGSVVRTLLETAAVEDFQQYVQMVNIIRNYNLDTTEGEELEARAAEYGLTKRLASKHSGPVSILDNRFNKISSRLFAGLPGPTAGSFTLYVNDASDFPASGSVYVGRGTPNTEGPIAYSATPVDQTSFWEITLDTALANDHGTDEDVILSQFGNRIVGAGTEVEIPETDFSQRVGFEINQTIELLDGENRVNDVLVTALEAGGFSVPANSIIEFSSEPFPGAAVINPVPFVNGRDEETDQELRDRIRETIQSLSRGTLEAIRNGILGVVDEGTNQSVVSAKIVPPATLGDGPTRVYIDNGRGLEPSIAPIGLETVLQSATGGEQFVQLRNFPLIRANLVTQQVAPFNLSGLETLIINVGRDTETFTFLPTDFRSSGAARATEVAEALNARSLLIEARTISDSSGRRVIITSKRSTNEDLSIGANSSALGALNFSTDEVSTLKLYKNDKLLVKDGLTGTLLSEPQPFNLNTSVVNTTAGDVTVTAGSKIVTSGTEPLNELVSPGDFIKFSTDSEIFYTKVRTVVSPSKVLLEEPYPVSGGGLGNINIWKSLQLEVAANGDLDETEVVSFGPEDIVNHTQALASEVFVRMREDIDLSKVELAANNTRVRLSSKLENSERSKMQVLGGAAAVALGFCTVSPQTGTVTIDSTDRVVIGSGTNFLEELTEGQWIKVASHGQHAWTKIESIEDNELLYLTENYRGDSEVTESFSAINFSALSQGANNDYVLNKSNGQIELTEPLIAGDRITAGSVDTRARVESSSQTFDFEAVDPLSSNLIVCVDGGITGSVTAVIDPNNEFESENLINIGDLSPNFLVGYQLRWVSGSNVGESSFISNYTPSTGLIEIITNTTNPIQASDQFELCQTLELDHTLFSDAENVTAAEVVEQLNSQIIGATTTVFENRIRIQSNEFSELSTIQVHGGSANSALAFPLQKQTSQLSNVAAVINKNSDQKTIPGTNFAGYSLGPAQSLIVILDGDGANKTFSINPRVFGEVTSVVSASEFSAAGLATSYNTTDYFSDFWIYWTSGPLEDTIQRVGTYTAVTGTLTTVGNVFPSAVATPDIGNTFFLIPSTARNVTQALNDFNITTLSIEGEITTIGPEQNLIQIATKEPGSNGKVLVAGGAANSLGIAVQGILPGIPPSGVAVNTITGLSKSLPILLTLDGTVTTGDSTQPYNTFEASALQSSLPNYFDGMDIEFLTGFNAGKKTTIQSYNEATGELVLDEATQNQILEGDTFRISTPNFISDIQGTEAPFEVYIQDETETNVDVSLFTPQRSASIRDLNGLNFSNTQEEGIDGYKVLTGLIQRVQWTIDGLESNPAAFPGIAAAGTQFEVLSPVIRRVRLIISLTPNEGISVSSLAPRVSNAVSEYINSLGVGEDVVLSEVVAAAQSILGVYDVEIQNIEENINIANDELARIETTDLTVG